MAVPTLEPRTIDLPPLCVRAAITPSSINETDRTIEVVFTTGAPVKRYDWNTGERYIEKLSTDPAHVRLDRINSGGPVLDSHSGYSLSSVLGVVEDGTAKMAAKRGTATLRFSKRADVDPVWTDVKDRVIRNVSVGYMVHAYQETAGKDGALKTRLAIDWEPYEISMVPMPADVGAQTRDGKPPAGTLTPCQILVRTDASEEHRMTPENPQPSETLVENTPLAPGGTRTAPETTTEAEPNDLDRGADVERERIQGIMDACRAAKMPSAVMDRLIKDKTPLVRAQSEIFEELGRRGGSNIEIRSQTHDVRLGPDPFVHVRAGIENALQHRVAPSYFKLEEVGREYRGMSMMDIAKLYVQQAMRVRTTGMTKMEIAGLALGLNTRTGMHTTSDFALLLADVASKTLRRAYEEVPQTFLPIARRITLPDFKPSKRLQIGDAPNLVEVKEHGEFTRGTIGEGSEAMQLATYGRIFAITRQALVNDDTDAFSRVPMLFGRAARKLEADLVWQQITSNPTMGDGNALFSTAHGNLQADGDVISILSLGRARLALRLQTGLDGETQVTVVPKYLIVPPSLETVAEQIVAPLINAQLATNQNVFSGKLTVIVEPRLEANSSQAWYLAASPDQVDIIEYAYLEGEEGPAIENRVGFDIDGLEIKARLDFAAKVVDWRGLHKDPGEDVS